MFLGYSELLNALDTGSTTKITINNKQLDRQDFEQKILLPRKNDYLDGYRAEYNAMLMDKVTDSSNSVVQERYITLSVHRKSVEEARAFFDRVTADVTTRLNHLDAHSEELDAVERLRVLHDFYRTGEETEYHMDLRDLMAKGHSFKDSICPDSLEFKKDHFIMDNKYGRVLFLKEYASYIKDSMINELTALNRTMMLSIDVIPVPTDEAVREMQNLLLGVETNVTNWQRRQNSNNNFSAVVPYDLEQQRKETREMLDDLTTRDQRMMFAVVTLVHLADQKGENNLKLVLTLLGRDSWSRPVYQGDERQCYNEQDILTVSAVLVSVEDMREPFWEMAARMLLECMIGYVLECLPDEEHNLCSVVKLLGEGKKFDRLLAEVCQIAPDSFTASRYKLSQTCRGADRMYSSILGILTEKLSPFAFDGARALFLNPKQINFRRLARRKTVVFLTVSDTDSSNYRLANLFYTQALHTLCGFADQRPGHRLPVPVRFILDDFAANVCIPDFDRIISVIRSREISVSVIIQSLSQLEALYGHARALTILNNCDNLLYLGGQDVETAGFIARKANKTPSSILQMPLDSAWLFTRGTPPREVRKYRLESHPLYQELPECSARQQDKEKCSALEEEPEGFSVA